MDSEVLNFLDDPLRNPRYHLRKFKVATAELARLYFEEGLPVKKIGDMFGMGELSVAQRLKNAGFTLRQRQGGRRPSVPLSELERLYFTEKMSANEVGTTVGLDGETVRKRLRNAGHALRKPIEGRDLAAWRMSDVKRRATYGGTHRMERHAMAKERRSQHRSKVPENERILLQFLTARGLTECVQQRAVGIYNVDFATPTVAIEVVGGRRKGSARAGLASTAERIYAILHAGFRMIEILHREPVDPLQEGAADEVISFIEHTKTLPPSIREYRMVGGAGQLLAVFKVDLNNVP